MALPRQGSRAVTLDHLLPPHLRSPPKAKKAKKKGGVKKKK